MSTTVIINGICFGEVNIKNNKTFSVRSDGAYETLYKTRCIEGFMNSGHNVNLVLVKGEDVAVLVGDITCCWRVCDKIHFEFIQSWRG